MSSMILNKDHHHFIVLTLLNHWISCIALPKAKGTMLDFGCGGQPYRALFATRIEHYIGADIEPAEGVTLDLRIEAGKPLPLKSQSVDTILSTQTLEHVHDFRAYIAECRRLLRPDGHLILTVPMQWRMHECPHDYWRFTRFGVLALLEEQGIQVVDLSPCGGAWALLGQVLNSHLAETRRGSSLVFRLINQLALWMDRRFPDLDETIGWMCVAKMPSRTG